MKPYLAEKENPIVTVRMGSYHVSVLGEVEKPGIIYAPQEKMSILEALAQCGDLTIYGKRDNVLLIRQDAAGEKHTYRMNLNDANIINSPFYYLQQNDIIYVFGNDTGNLRLDKDFISRFHFAGGYGSVSRSVTSGTIVSYTVTLGWDFWYRKTNVQMNKAAITTNNAIFRNFFVFILYLRFNYLRLI